MEPVERVHVEVDGVLGLVPQSWPPGPVHVAAVLPSSVLASRIGVGDELVKVNDANVCDLDRSALARELSRRPLSLEIKRFASLPRECFSETIDVQVGVSDGAVGFCPRDWHSKPIVVGAVLPNQAAAAKGVREGDVLVLVDGQQANSMTAAELATALSRRPISIRFQRLDGSETARGDQFLASLDAAPPPRTGASAAAADADAGGGRDERELLPSPIATATAKEGTEVSESAAPRRPPKPRRPVKLRSKQEPQPQQEQRELTESTRRPPQPAKPATKPAKSEAPREAREGGTQTEVTMTADKGVQPDIEPQDLEELAQPLSAESAHVVSFEEEEEAHSEAQACDQDVDEVAAAASADLPALLRPPSIPEPQPDMPPLRPRDFNRTPSPEPFKFRELPPPRAPPALWDEPSGDLENIAVAKPRSLRPSMLKELPPPDRPPLPVETEAELRLWRHVPEDLKPNSPETTEDLEEWLRWPWNAADDAQSNSMCVLLRPMDRPDIAAADRKVQTQVVGVRRGECEGVFRGESVAESRRECREVTGECGRGSGVVGEGRADRGEYRGMVSSGRGVSIVSVEVQRGFCLGLGIAIGLIFPSARPPVFIKTQTGAVVTQVTQESFLAAGIVGAVPIRRARARADLINIDSPCIGLSSWVPSGLQISTREPRSDRDLLSIMDMAPVGIPDVLRSVQCSQVDSCLFVCFQDALVLASKDAPALRPANVLVLQEQQDDQAAPAKEPPSEKQRCLEAATENHAKTMQEQREHYESMLEEQREQHEAMLEEQRQQHEGMLEEQREQHEGMLEVEHRRAEQAEAKLAMAETAQEEAEQREIQEVALEAPAGTMQRVLMGPAWFLSRCLSQCRQFVGFRLPPKKHDKQAARRIHAQNLQEQREQHEGMFEVERLRAELERDRCQQAEEKCALALQLQEQALATVKTVSEVHEKKLEEMQASYRKQLSMERNSRLQAEAELRKLQAELEKFSMVSISDSELATEAETAPAQASSSSSTPPDAQPHTAETQPSFRATSSVRQIAEMPPAGQMPRGDYRAITCWQEAGVYGKKPEELRAGRAAEDGTSEQEQAERVQEVRTLYRAKHGPYSKPNAAAWLPMDAI
ncbi:hypothetical protein AK812_SmicGene32848 [Symbiodinium microadriaticum]|uniref:PDZ domain-containing protein n=1 Tax=Symbiodinium microadriaticum TaxID=2951 RepID=A0A1Q9CT15_SYMMI|nr:hypothetical protein AK812_SmicGene32848 [Symbiodinium microadriaticum]